MADFVAVQSPVPLREAGLEDSPTRVAALHPEPGVEVGLVNILSYVYGAPPVVAFVTPAPGGALERRQPVRVTITDRDVAAVVVSVRFAAIGIEEVVYRAGRFASMYAESTVEVDGDVTTFVLRRRGGWIASPTVQLDVVDRTGQVV